MKINNPLISIVTVVYNGEKFLEETIQSVINQSYKNIEYIIIDGGSTDGTVDIIKKYEEHIDYWVSERDEGIYNAMNKGIKLAKGDFINFMNAGDMFINDKVIFDVVNSIEDMSFTYFGRAEIFTHNNFWHHPSNNINKENIIQWLKNEQPNHQAMFFPKSFYISQLYDLKYKIFGDSDYKYRAELLTGFKFIDITVCRFAFGGISSEFSTYKDVVQMMKEAWRGREYKGTIHCVKRIVVYNIKYILKILLGHDRFANIVNRVKN